MKADWLNDFISELAQLKEIVTDIRDVVVYHRSRGAWYCGDDSAPNPSALDEAFSKASYQKIGSSKVYAFPLTDADVIVHVTFAVFPKGAKLTSVYGRIEQVRENSRHRFDALHDSLTGCKNRKSFEADLSAAIDSLASSSGASGLFLPQGGVNSVSLATLDIDFFKRVNDSRGHDYGDLVLRAFAWCVSDFCQKVIAQRPKLRLNLYRLGGEEFNLLFRGDIDEREVLDVLDRLRIEIEQNVTPSDHQVAVFGSDGITIPPASERRVTVSFGVARLSGVVISQNAVAAAGRLKIHADKALYSAKGAGRNCVRYFPDILKKYGRVLEHDSSAGVVVIDIGLEAGVVKGREFFVVPERYTGDTSYVVDDGRSRRTLGKYPRIKTAKLVAFDVQSEISFCSISERRDGVDVIEGAFLESIPLGLFGGLSGLHGYNELPRESEAAQALRSWMADVEDDRRRVMSIRFTGIRDVEKMHGSVKANEILAGAVAAAKRVFPAPMKIVQTEVGQFGVAFACDENLATDMVASMVGMLHELCSDVVDFSLGLFDRDSMGADSDSQYSLDVSAAYDYATIAAASAQKNSWRLFDGRAPCDVMSSNYYAGEYEKVIADYDRFKELGIVGSTFENFAGLSHFISGNVELAGSYFRAAVEYKDSPIIRSSLAITQFMAGRFLDSYDNLRQALAGNNGVHPNEDAESLFAVAAWETYLIRGVPDLHEVRGLFEGVNQEDYGSFLKPGQFEVAEGQMLKLVNS